VLVFLGKRENTNEFLTQWFCKYKGVLSMILLTGKAHLTEKVLWHVEPNYRQKLE
jgi:hypothetical protein